MKEKIKKNKGGIPTINISQLKEMATTKKLKDILKKYIEDEKIQSVRNAWIEYFLDIQKKS